MSISSPTHHRSYVRESKLIRKQCHQCKKGLLVQVQPDVISLENNNFLFCDNERCHYAERYTEGRIT